MRAVCAVSRSSVPQPGRGGGEVSQAAAAVFLRVQDQSLEIQGMSKKKKKIQGHTNNPACPPAVCSSVRPTSSAPSDQSQVEDHISQPESRGSVSGLDCRAAVKQQVSNTASTGRPVTRIEPEIGQLVSPVCKDLYLMLQKFEIFIYQSSFGISPSEIKSKVVFLELPFAHSVPMDLSLRLRD